MGCVVVLTKIKTLLVLLAVGFMVADWFHSKSAAFRKHGFIKSHTTKIGLHESELISALGDAFARTKHFCEALDPTAHPRVCAPMKMLPAVGIEIDVAKRSMPVMPVMGCIRADTIPIILDLCPPIREMGSVISMSGISNVVGLPNID